MTQPAKRGLRVLQTRPRHQAGPLKEAIEKAGGEVIDFPVMDIVAHGVDCINAELADRPAADIVLFVSPNAVQHGLAAAAGASQIAAIGAATAEALRRAGHPADIVPTAGFDSEALLREPGLQRVQGKRVRIVRGDGGRELLADELAARGAQIDFLEVYRRTRHPASKTALAELESGWRKDRIDYVIAMSVASLQFLLELLPASCRLLLPTSVLVTPSARVLKTAQERTLGMRTLLSKSPATGDLLAAMLADRHTQTDKLNE